jgi:hypothetical protein
VPDKFLGRKKATGEHPRDKSMYDVQISLDRIGSFRSIPRRQFTQVFIRIHNHRVDAPPKVPMNLLRHRNGSHR